MRLDLLVAVLAVLVVLAVPTAALSSHGEDEVGNAVTLSPSDGPNGEYASVEDGELRVDFDGVLYNASHLAHDVFTITATSDEPVQVWIATDLGDGVSAYKGDDHDTTVDSRDDAIELQPNETISVGFEIDTHEEIPDNGTITVGVLVPDNETVTPTPTAPTDTTPTDTTPTETETPTDSTPADSTPTATETPNETETPTDSTPTETETPEETPEPGTPNESVQMLTTVRASADVVTAGQTSNVVATITNMGDQADTFELTFSIEDEEIETISVPLDPGESQNVSFEGTIEEPGRYNVSVRAVDSAGRSDAETMNIVVNDEPTVRIEAVENATTGNETTYLANVTNLVGSETVTWTLSDRSTVTGREITVSQSPGETIRVTVRDEYGASTASELTLSPAAASSEAGLVPQIAAVPLRMPMWLQFGMVTVTVTIVAILVRSPFLWRIGSGVRDATVAMRETIRATPPRIQAIETPRWDPERGAIVIDELDVRAPDGLLESVEISVMNEAGDTVVRKTIDAGGRESYTADPEQIHLHGDIELSETGTYTLRIRAVDELERAGTWQQSREGLFSLPSPQAA